MADIKELAGAWEEPGVIGTRIEIEGKKISVLWRNSPVLETSFKIKDTDGGTALILKDDKLRNPGDAAPYAKATGLVYANGTLTFTELFDIAGEKTMTLKKTEQSRYGNYTVVDKEMLPLLKGNWKSEDGSFELKISGNKITAGAEKTRIHVLKNNGYDEIKIADEDPVKYGLLHFVNVRYENGFIYADIPVCDAPSVTLRFTKE